LVDRRLEPHDSNQLELKLAYGIESAERHQRYRVETFIFVPTTLGLSAKTYTAERFYEDTTGFIRLKTPTVALASLADPCLAGDWFDPLSERLDALLGGAARPDGSTSRRLKLMGCIFRRSLRSEMLDILERFDRLAPASTSEGAAGDSELSEELLADSRFSVREGDAYATLDEQSEERWDLVLIDIDHAPDDHLGPGNESFYTESGLARAKHHLAPEGILAVWSYAESSPFVDALRAAFSVVEIVPVRYVNDLVGEEHTDWLFLARD
jgi:hypothetical protein